MKALLFIPSLVFMAYAVSCVPAIAAETPAQLEARVKAAVPKHDEAIRKINDNLQKLWSEYSYAEDMTPRNKLGEVLDEIKGRISKEKARLERAKAAKLEALHEGPDAERFAKIDTVRDDLKDKIRAVEKAQRERELARKELVRAIDMGYRDGKVNQAAEEARAEIKKADARFEKVKAAKEAAYGPEAEKLLRDLDAADEKLLRITSSSKIDPSLWENKLAAGEKLVESQKIAPVKVKARGRAAKLGALSVGAAAIPIVVDAMSGEGAQASEVKSGDFEIKSNEEPSDVSIKELDAE